MMLACYVGTRAGIMGLGNRLIRLRLQGDVSHCEIVFQPGDGVDALMPDGTCQPDYDGKLWCASSVGLERLPSYSPVRAGRMGGVRFKRIDVQDDDKWQLIPLRSSASAAASFAHKTQGVLYDWSYIAGFLAWPITHNANRLACSEACAAMLGIPSPHRFEPCALQSLAWSGKI